MVGLLIRPPRNIFNKSFNLQVQDSHINISYLLYVMWTKVPTADSSSVERQRSITSVAGVDGRHKGPVVADWLATWGRLVWPAPPPPWPLSLIRTQQPPTLQSKHNPEQWGGLIKQYRSHPHLTLTVTTYMYPTWPSHSLFRVLALQWTGTENISCHNKTKTGIIRLATDCQGRLCFLYRQRPVMAMFQLEAPAQERVVRWGGVNVLLAKYQHSPTRPPLSSF